MDKCTPQSMTSERDELKSYSCVTCRQRKVKCDRHNPCSNCKKAQTQCSFVPPTRGKRKRTRPAKEGLHAKLQRYEELLKSYGAAVEPSKDEPSDGSESDAASVADVAMSESADPQKTDQMDRDAARLEDARPTLISKDGMTRYFDSALWSKLGAEFDHPEVTGLGEPVKASTTHDSDLFFEPEGDYDTRDLSSLHPPLSVLPNLKEIYADRVDPLMKVVHLPTFWNALSGGLQQPRGLSKELEAMAFAFYFATTRTMKEDECQSMFGVSNSALYSRYRLATRQALTRASFLSTSSPMTLRAYAIFIMCLRSSYQVDALFILSGIAIRLARKMGLHRDGTTLGLSPFETEMRRRLWWHLVHVDVRTAEVLGSKPSMDLSSPDVDVKMPLNVEDEDLSPDMKGLPAERRGITSITLCLVRCELMNAFRNFDRSSSTYPTSSTTPKPQAQTGYTWLYATLPSLSHKTTIVAHVEDLLEQKYLRYCDPSNPLHTFVSIMIRAAICKMKLFAHNPRSFASRSTSNNGGEAPTESERSAVLTNALKLLEYVVFMQSSPMGMEKYMWQIGTSYLWNTMLYVLIESRHRKTGPEVERSWALIGKVFELYPQVYEETTGPVFTALGKWTLEVWGDYGRACKERGLAEPRTPGYIDRIQQCRKPSNITQHRANEAAEGGPDRAESTVAQDGMHVQAYDAGSYQVGEPMDFYGFPDLMTFETDPNIWLEWENLIADQGGSNQNQGFNM